MRNEVTILILQDRSIGLETRQDDLRRVRIFPFFSYAPDLAELKKALTRSIPDVVLLVQKFFPVPFEDVQHELRERGLQVPIIVMLPAGQDIQGIELMKRGAQDYLLETELGRLAPSILLALRVHPAREASAHAKSIAPNADGFRFEPASANGTPTAESLIGSLIDIVTELDLVGNILYESPSVFDQLGYAQEELIGRNAFSLIHPLDVPRVMPVFMLAFASPGIPHSARFRFKHKNGEWRILESVGKSILTQDSVRRMIVTSRVFKEEVRARGKLGESEARFMDVVENLGEGILITDTSDKILYANKQMAEFTGYSVGDLLGKLSYKLFLPEAAWALYMEQKEKWLLGNREEYEISIPRKDGIPLCMHVNVSPFRSEEGHITGTLTAFTDITKRKSAEEEIQRTFEHLKAAKERAEEMNRLKTSFLNNVGHEVRTPLNSILGFSSLMSEMLVGTEYATYAATIQSSGKRLLDTFESILDLSSVESNTLVLVPSRVYLDAEVHRTALMLAPQAREKGLEMTVDAPTSIVATIDAHYFGRVIKNLIANAIKFTPAGSIQIRLRRGNDSNSAEIEIEDTGIGISEEFLPHLFEEFYQESDGLARKFEGTGLGLRISKRLLDQMGGSLAVKSKKGKGSCFTITVPLNVPVMTEAMV